MSLPPVRLRSSMRGALFLGSGGNGPMNTGSRGLTRGVYRFEPVVVSVFELFGLAASSRRLDTHAPLPFCLGKTGREYSSMADRIWLDR